MGRWGLSDGRSNPRTGARRGARGRRGRPGGTFSLAAVKLEYKKHFFYDLRYYGVAGHDFNKATSARHGPEDALYFCLP